MNTFKTIFLIACFCMMWLTGFSQGFLVYKGDTINRKDANNKKYGLWINFDASKQQVVEKGFYVDGKKDGLWISYFPNGKEKHRITFKNGIASGLAVFYYENGKMWEQGIWEIDHWVGKYQFFYPSGQIAYDWNYNKAGKRNGVQKYYHENGNVKYSGSWENGKTSGTLKIFSELGELSGERIYKEGKFEKTISYGNVNDETDPVDRVSSVRFTGTGNHTVYDLSGKIEKKGYFIKGKLMKGEQYVYDSEGKLSSVLVFENGELVNTLHKD
ncbi:MAG: toxin-antitoxin system YwqK family antitoxin [Marinilabiliaceae bacterium]|nr:toxin-antitoxin system YwqK family antitoxin [Marinilabiliaceae bacterium]